MDSRAAIVNPVDTCRWFENEFCCFCFDRFLSDSFVRNGDDDLTTDIFDDIPSSDDDDDDDSDSDDDSGVDSGGDDHDNEAVYVHLFEVEHVEPNRVDFFVYDPYFVIERSPQYGPHAPGMRMSAPLDDGGEMD